MVSLRRRRLLGLCSGVQGSVVDPPSMTLENGHAAGNEGISSNPASARRMLLDDLNLPPREVDDTMETCDSPNVIGCSNPEAQNTKPNFCYSSSSKEPTQVAKRRKQYRRRHVDNHEPMIGVYPKNSKWQAAIKVDKKQIHLGTLDSQEEAVHLYDRAAFICGRDTNLELSQEEKQELRNLKWDDFLATTRSSISFKRTRRRQVKRPTADSSDDEGEQVAEPLANSDDAELDAPNS